MRRAPIRTFKIGFNQALYTNCCTIVLVSEKYKKKLAPPVKCQRFVRRPCPTPWRTTAQGRGHAAPA